MEKNEERSHGGYEEDEPPEVAEMREGAAERRAMRLQIADDCLTESLRSPDALSAAVGSCKAMLLEYQTHLHEPIVRTLAEAGPSLERAQRAFPALDMQTRLFRQTERLLQIEQREKVREDKARNEKRSRFRNEG